MHAHHDAVGATGGSPRLSERLPLCAGVATHPPVRRREGERGRESASSAWSIDSRPSNDRYQRCATGRPSVHCTTAGADCIRLTTTTTTIYYECHTNTGQRSNFVIESKPLSTHRTIPRAAERSGVAPVRAADCAPPDHGRSSTPNAPTKRAAGRRRPVHRRCPGTEPNHRTITGQPG